MVESSTSKEDTTLKRKDYYFVFSEIEAEPEHTDPKDLEDVTDLVFSAMEHLKDCELLCEPNFDLHETMSAFEAMDPKMDIRLKRTEVPHPEKLKKDGILITDKELTNGQLIALLEEFLT